VSLKKHLADKTNWQQMLKNVSAPGSLLENKMKINALLDQEYVLYLVEDKYITSIRYPVLKYPLKIKSLKLDTTPIIEKKLVGIKGQYLLFEDDSVINIRSHAGYKVSLDC
jgi:hypothetical protein